MTAKKLSIIIPMYNAEKYIGNCLESILNQNLDPAQYEIIIINDGSTDKSIQIVNEYAISNDNIIILSQSNSGQSSARNNGISKATGDFLFFIDADDFLIPDSLSDVFRPIFDTAGACHQGGVISCISTAYQECDMICFGITGGNPENHTFTDYHQADTKFETVVTGYEYIAKHNYNNGPCWYFIKRTFINKFNLRFVEGKLCEDGMFTMTALLNAKKVGHISRYVYFYAERPDSTTKTYDRTRLNKLNEGFRYAITYFSELIEYHHKTMGSECYNRLIIRRNSYIVFLLIRLLKFKAGSEVSQTIEWLIQSGLYPIKKFIGHDYNGLSLRIIFYIINHKHLYLAACRVFKFMH